MAIERCKAVLGRSWQMQNVVRLYYNVPRRSNVVWLYCYVPGRGNMLHGYIVTFPLAIK